MIKPSFEVYNPLISYIRQASRKFPKWGLKLCCFPDISNHLRFSVMPFQMYLWVERNHCNFWHILLLRNNLILSVSSDFSVDYIYFLFPANSICNHSNNSIQHWGLKELVFSLPLNTVFSGKRGWESIRNTPTSTFVPSLVFWVYFKDRNSVWVCS